jgi:fucose permease
MKGSADDVPAQPDVSRRQTIGYYGAFFALGLITAAIGPTLPALAQQTSSQKSEVSSVIIARSFGFIAGSLLAGRLYDRVKGHPLLSGALFLLAAVASLIPVPADLWQLVILFLIQGIMGSTVSVGGNTLLIWAHRNQAGSLLSGLHFIWGVGAFLSPVIVARTMKFSSNIGLAYWILAMMTLPICLWIMRQPNPPHPRKSASSSAGTVIVPLALMICAFLFLYTGMEACFGNWIYTYALETGLSSITSAAYLNSVFWGALTLGRLLNIPLSSRLRPRTILTLDLTGCLLSVLAMLIWQRSATVLWAAIGTLGLSMGSIFPTVISFAGRRMSLSGQLTGILFASASAGAMCLPWLVGQFLDRVGSQMLLYTALSALLTNFIIFTLMMTYPQRVSPPPESAEESEDVQAASELVV